MTDKMIDPSVRYYTTDSIAAQRPVVVFYAGSSPLCQHVSMADVEWPWKPEVKRQCMVCGREE